MEKSLVRQFTGFGTQSNAFFGTATKNGFIRTFKDQTDLGKSRIQNLPSYKKDDLSKRVQMVVVFQAIQISRLSVQIESLRVQLKDSERQLQNYLSYQIQIKELNQQSLRLQQENLQYKQEIQKMNMICQKMYLELQEMHRKYDHVDLKIEQKLKIVLKENKKLQQEMDDIKKSLTQKTEAITQSNQKLKKKVTFQQNQIQKLSQNLKQSKQQVNNQVINQLNRLKHVQKDFELRQKQFMKQLEEKTTLLNNMKTIVKQRLHQNEKEKFKFKNIEGNWIEKFTQLQNVVKQHDKQFQKQIQLMSKELQLVENKLIRKQQQLTELKNMYEHKLINLEKLSNEIKNKYEFSRQQNLNFQNQNKKLCSEIQSMKKIITQKSNQCKELETKLVTLQNQLLVQLKRLNQQKQIISDNLIKIMKQMEIKSDQLKQYKHFALTLKKQHQNVITQKQKIFESFKSTIQQMEKLYQLLEDEKNKNYQYHCKVQDLTNILRKFQNQKRFSESQIKSLQNQLMKTSQQKSQIESQLSNLNIKIQDIDRKAIQNQKNYQLNLSKIKSDHQNELKSQQKIFQSIISQFQSIKQSFDIQIRQKNDLTQRFVELRKFSESQSLSINQLVKNLETAQKILKQTKFKQDKNMRQNSDKMSNAMSKTNQIFKIHQNWVNKIIQMQDLISLLQNQNLKLDSENNLLNFQMVETHKINTMQKRRDSRTSTESSSLKSFINSTSMLKDKGTSFLRKANKDSIVSDISQSQPSQRRIFAQLQNKV